jgi:hypothetical protein
VIAKILNQTLKGGDEHGGQKGKLRLRLYRAKADESKSPEKQKKAQKVQIVEAEKRW